MWTPPWAGPPSALGAFGLAPLEDRILADKVSSAVADNLRAGRKFYDPVPQDFKDKFQQIARGIYRYLIYHDQYMPKGLTPDERETLAVKVVNKTYYNALRGIAGFRAEASMKGWIYKIARNALIDELRMFIRSPRGAARLREYRMDATNEVEKAKALQAEAEAAMDSTDFDLPATMRGPDDAQFRAITRLVSRMLRVGRDLQGREFVRPEDSVVLASYIRARGSRDRVAADLRMSVSETNEKLDAALTAVTAALPRLQQTLAARGETV